MPDHFDFHAKKYDDVFTRSQIGKAQRKRVYFYLNKFVLTQKKQSVLELNCGTGEDASYLTQIGNRVIATDIATEMIRVASLKFPTIDFRQQDIIQLTETSFTEKFDVVFSNFGGLNCLSPNELKKFLAVSKNLLSPTGKLVMVFMPKNCLWEQLYFTLKGDFKKAKRRNTTEAVSVHVSGRQVPTWYYNPNDVLTLMPKDLKTLAIKPVGIAIPPSYLESSFLTKPVFFNLLNGFEKWFSSSFWARYADHFMIVLQKE